MERLTRFKKTVIISLQFIAVITIISTIAGSFSAGRFTLAYIFPANFITGAAIILAGLILLALPVRLKFGKLNDHTTYGYNFLELRMQKREKANEIIWLGISIFVISAVVQLLLYFII
ncbi:MAG: hypothetical protein FWE91_02840 [Defluviitaleaceae bacterium]|nr:hypothetical protein [Defluviitaleaceae bacterium]MCL2837318.1 hypothetical protein [Defluviitaleaceae bacterium]